MDLTAPYTAALRRHEAAVVRVLAGTTEGMSGRRIHMLADTGALRSTQTALARLADEGLVEVADHGNLHLYTLNRDHIAAGPLLALVDLHRALLTGLRARVTALRPVPAYAALFGSGARGDGRPGSDLDLLIVRPNAVAGHEAMWESQLTALSDGLRRWTGNHAGIIDLTREDLRAAVARQEPIIAELHRDAVTLAGPESFQAFLRRL